MATVSYPVMNLGSTSQQAAQKAPGTQPASAVAKTAPAGTAPRPAAGPAGSSTALHLDPTYWSNVAILNAHAQQDQAMLNLQGAQSQASFALQQKIDAEARRRGIRNTAESLIGTGLLRSGYHNRTQKEMTIDFMNEQAQKLMAKQQADAVRQAQMAAIAQNLGLDVFGEGVASNQREIDRLLNAAANAPPAAPTDSGGATNGDGGGGAPAPPVAGRPTPAQIEKAKKILANKAKYDKAAINWAIAIMARR